jgi:hypothetical protein
VPAFEQEFDAELFEDGPKLFHDALRARLVRIFEANDRASCHARSIGKLLLREAKPCASSADLLNVNHVLALLMTFHDMYGKIIPRSLPSAGVTS